MLLTVTAPVAVWLMPVTVSVPVASFRLMMPATLLLALKLLTALVAVLRSVPVAEEVVSRPPVTTPAAVWVMLVEAARLTALAPALIAPGVSVNVAAAPVPPVTDAGFDGKDE